jgi:hypothetical protein
MNCCFYCFNNHCQYNSPCSKYLDFFINYYKNLNLDPLTIKITSEFRCTDCNRYLKNKQNYNYHIKNKVCKKNKENKCLDCNKIFSSKQMLNYHILNNVCGLIKQTDNLHLNIDENKNKSSNSITNNTDNSTHTNNNTNNSTNTNNTDNSTTNNIQTQNNNNQQNLSLIHI